MGASIGQQVARVSVGSSAGSNDQGSAASTTRLSSTR
jgi:hypothetical protein